MRTRLLLAIVAAGVLGATTTARAQTFDVDVDPLTPAPGAPVTVTVSSAQAGDPVIVQLGLEEESTTVDQTGNAQLDIAAPTEVGETVGTVRVGVVDFPFTVTVVAVSATTTTIATTTTVATTTTTVPVAAPAATGIDDAGTQAAVAAAVVAAGVLLASLARRPAAVSTRGSTTRYRIVIERRRPRT